MNLPRVRLGQNLFDDTTVDIRESKVPTGMAISEPFMIEAHDVENRGVKIVNMDGVLDHLVADVVRLTVNDSGPDAAAREPAREGRRMVSARLGALAALGPGSPSELRAKHE